jgi:uncharacterized protein (UPF0332 family)
LTRLNPEHFFEQAERLTVPASAGAPRQVDLRRAISSVYYGVFHATLTAAADQFVGVTKRSTDRYALAYRSVDHNTLRSLCLELKNQNVSPRIGRHSPPKGFGPNIQAFAAAVLELQEKRLAADYDPLMRIKASDALSAITSAREALRRFRRASGPRRTAFLSLLLFRPR